MAVRERNWKYVDESVNESHVMQSARTHARELGREPVSPAVAAAITTWSAAVNANAMIEIGTGTGVTGLALMTWSPDNHLTTIDLEPEAQAIARNSFSEAGIAPTRYRFINGRASEVLPRMNEGSYDLVLVNAELDSVIEYVEHGLRLVKPGGLVLITGGLTNVADPTTRDAASVALRALVSELDVSNAVVSSVSPAGEGLLSVVKLA